jgi:hypothetical protein
MSRKWLFWLLVTVDTVANNIREWVCMLDGIWHWMRWLLGFSFSLWGENGLEKGTKTWYFQNFVIKNIFNWRICENQIFLSAIQTDDLVCYTSPKHILSMLLRAFLRLQQKDKNAAYIDTENFWIVKSYTEPVEEQMLSDILIFYRFCQYNRWFSTNSEFLSFYRVRN